MWQGGGCQSVVNRGDRGEPIFPTDDDRRRFPGSLSAPPGLEWQKVLVRYGDWTRDAVVCVAVRLGGWRLSELLKPG